MKLVYSFLIACLITTAFSHAAQLETAQSAGNAVHTSLEKLKSGQSDEQKQLAALTPILQKLIDNQGKQDKQITILQWQQDCSMNAVAFTGWLGAVTTLSSRGFRLASTPFLALSLFYLWRALQQLQIINKLESELVNNSQSIMQKKQATQ